MPEASTTHQSGFTSVLSQLGLHGSGRESIIQQFLDSDTVNMEAPGSLSVKFLGADKQ